jgi:uncharacterized protein YoxC
VGLIDILVAVLIVLASALVVYLIITLKKVNENLELLEKDLSEVTERLNPILENVNEITEKALAVSSEAESQVEKIKNYFKDIEEGFSKISLLKKENDPSKRVPNLIKNLSALSKGVLVFLHELKK